mmetsp:Transcript_6980/g.12557  ORF Transcript_6980/g.12557 Transcript_6980/m.12557 type:complete len:882 (-) Transcript_6980:438-3083(-)
MPAALQADASGALLDELEGLDAPVRAEVHDNLAEVVELVLTLSHDLPLVENLDDLVADSLVSRVVVGVKEFVDELLTTELFNDVDRLVHGQGAFRLGDVEFFAVTLEDESVALLVPDEAEVEQERKQAAVRSKGPHDLVPAAGNGKLVKEARPDFAQKSLNLRLGTLREALLDFGNSRVELLTVHVNERSEPLRDVVVELVRLLSPEEHRDHQGLRKQLSVLGSLQEGREVDSGGWRLVVLAGGKEDVVALPENRSGLGGGDVRVDGASDGEELREVNVLFLVGVGGHGYGARLVASVGHVRSEGAGIGGLEHEPHGGTAVGGFFLVDVHHVPQPQEEVDALGLEVLGHFDLLLLRLADGVKASLVGHDGGLLEVLELWNAVAFSVLRGDPVGGVHAQVSRGFDGTLDDIRGGRREADFAGLLGNVEGDPNDLGASAAVEVSVAVLGGGGEQQVLREDLLLEPREAGAVAPDAMLADSKLLAEQLAADSLHALHAKEEERDVVLALGLVEEGEEEVGLSIVDAQVLHSVVEAPPVRVGARVNILELLLVGNLFDETGVGLEPRVDELREPGLALLPVAEATVVHRLGVENGAHAPPHPEEVAGRSVSGPNVGQHEAVTVAEQAVVGLGPIELLRDVFNIAHGLFPDDFPLLRDPRHVHRRLHAHAASAAVGGGVVLLVRSVVVGLELRLELLDLDPPLVLLLGKGLNLGVLLGQLRGLLLDLRLELFNLLVSERRFDPLPQQLVLRRLDLLVLLGQVPDLLILAHDRAVQVVHCDVDLVVLHVLEDAVEGLEGVADSLHLLRGIRADLDSLLVLHVGLLLDGRYSAVGLLPQLDLVLQPKTLGLLEPPPAPDQPRDDAVELPQRVRVEPGGRLERVGIALP